MLSQSSRNAISTRQSPAVTQLTVLIMGCPLRSIPEYRTAAAMEKRKASATAPMESWALNAALRRVMRGIPTAAVSGKNKMIQAIVSGVMQC